MVQGTGHPWWGRQGLGSANRPHSRPSVTWNSCDRGNKQMCCQAQSPSPHTPTHTLTYFHPPWIFGQQAVLTGGQAAVCLSLSSSHRHSGRGTFISEGVWAGFHPSPRSNRTKYNKTPVCLNVR